MPPTTTAPAQQKPAPKQRTAAVRPPIPDLEVYAEVGDTVEWYSGADRSQKPTCGVTTKVGLDATLTVNRCSPDLCDTVPQDGCRHIDDPKAKLDSYAGGWRHRRITVATRAMLIKMGVLKWVYDREWSLEVAAELQPEAPPASPAPPAA